MASEAVPAAHRLPPELLRLIFDATHDWELAEACQVAHSLPINPPFLEQATPLDHAILGSAFSFGPIKRAIEAGNVNFTQWGTRAMLRFSLIHCKSPSTSLGAKTSATGRESV